MGEVEIITATLASIAIACVVTYFAVRPLVRLRIHPADTPITRPGDRDDDFIAVPVSRIYYLRQGALWQVRAVSGARPALTIGPKGLRFRALREGELSFAAIEQVDVRRGLLGGIHILFLSEQNSHVLAAHVPDVTAARRALAALPGALPLSTAAAILRDGSAAAATPGLRRYRGAFR
jgi:hypothetical protein